MKNPTRTLRLSLLATLLAAACAAPALAADPAKPATKPAAAKPAAAAPAEAEPEDAGTVLTFGKGTAKGTVLTRDELRACIKSQGTIKADGEALLKEKNELTAQKTEMERLEAELVAERAGVDASKEESVAAYNVKLTAGKERSAALRERQLGFNNKVDAYQAGNEAFKRDCADRPYTELDWFAIQRGK